jgi:thioester reductase-like protein
VTTHVRPPPEASNANALVLLTGATGFLGSHILAQLLSTTAWRVACLVRSGGGEEDKSQDDDDGLGRLRACLKAHGALAGWEEVKEEEEEGGAETQADALAGRVVVVRGDLALPRLGLSSKDARLFHDDNDGGSGGSGGGGLSAIVHCGALVHHWKTYEDLRAANVLGSLECLRLACTTSDDHYNGNNPGCRPRSQALPLHLVSTMSVLHCEETAMWHHGECGGCGREKRGSNNNSSGGGASSGAATPSHQRRRRRRSDEDSGALLGESLGSAGGYAQSKWAAETCLRHPQVPHGCVTVVRPGTVSGHSASGALTLSDTWCRLLASFAVLRCVPCKGNSTRGGLELLPVDRVASFIVASVRDPLASGQTHNLAGAKPVSLVAVLRALRSFGYGDAKAVYFGEFVARAQEEAAAAAEAPRPVDATRGPGGGGEATPTAGRAGCDAVAFVAAVFAAHGGCAAFPGKVPGYASTKNAAGLALRHAGSLEPLRAQLEGPDAGGGSHERGKAEREEEALLHTYLRFLVKKGAILPPPPQGLDGNPVLG